MNSRLVDSILIFAGCLYLAYAYGIGTGAAVLAVVGGLRDMRKYF